MQFLISAGLENAISVSARSLDMARPKSGAMSTYPLTDNDRRSPRRSDFRPLGTFFLQLAQIPTTARMRRPEFSRQSLNLLVDIRGGKGREGALTRAATASNRRGDGNEPDRACAHRTERSDRGAARS